MKSVTMEHVFHCDVDTFWNKIFFDEQYNRKLFLEELQFPAWEQHTEQQTDALVRRVVKQQPPIGASVPAAVRKVLGDRFGYTERGTFDRKTKRYHIEIEPSTAADKSRISGDFWLEPDGENRSRRIAKIQIEVRVMIIGKLIEEMIMADMTRSYEKAADFTNQWIKTLGS